MPLSDYNGQQKKNFKAQKVSYLPKFGALIPNLTITFKFMELILQCCQFCGLLVENYILENISQIWKKFKLFFFNLVGEWNC